MTMTTLRTLLALLLVGSLAAAAKPKPLASPSPTPITLTPDRPPLPMTPIPLTPDRPPLPMTPVPLNPTRPPLPSAEPEWVDTGHQILIDVANFRSGADGLVYFQQRRRSYDTDDEGNPAGASWSAPSKAAVDCAQRLSYSSYSIEYDADWRSKGSSSPKNTMGGVLLDFVCDRATAMP